jgi:hypothetical protein
VGVASVDAIGVFVQIIAAGVWRRSTGFSIISGPPVVGGVH